jgi:hypothetical protein
MGGGGSCEWRYNLCENGQTYKGSYTRVKAHILHEGVKCVDVCAHIINLEVRATFEKEHNDAQKLKEQRNNIGIGSDTHLAASNKPRIVHETRKRRGTA